MRRSPVILTGNQRSGTTYLAKFLASSPRSSFGVEDGVIRQAIIWFGWLSDRPELLPYNRFNEFFRILQVRSDPAYADVASRMERMLRADFEAGRLDFKHRSNDVSEFIAEICSRFYLEGEEPVQPEADLAFWGDKYPEYCFMLDEVLAVFPDAKFLFLVRHPHSCVEALSRKIDAVSRNFGKAMRDVEDCALQWGAWNRQWLRFRATLPPSQMLEIRYEDLVSNPRTVIDDVSSFVGCDLTEDAQFQRFIAGLDPSKLDAYRLSPLLAEIEEHCSDRSIVDVATEFGYDLAVR